MVKKRLTHTIVIGIIRILLLFALIGAYLNGRWLVFFVAGLALVVTFIPFILWRLHGIRIPAEFEIMVLLFIYGTLFFGEVRGFLGDFWWWDVLLNIASAIALGFVGLTVLYVLYKDEKLDASPFVIFVFTFSFALAIGTMWEIFEFAMDSFFGFTLQDSLLDTMGDIISNAIGSFIVALGGYFYIRDGKIFLVSSFISKFIEGNPRLFRSRKILENPSLEIKRIIRKGESEKLEFKSTLRTNLHTGEFDKKVEHSVLKTLVAYLNTKGGTLLVGVSDSGVIAGLEKDKFPDNDKLSLYVTNMIKHQIGSAFLPFIQYELYPIEDKHVLKIDCLGSDKPVFLKIGKVEEFYVRNGPSSAKLDGSELVNYINNKFKEK